MSQAYPEATAGTSRRRLTLAAIDGRRGVLAVFVASVGLFGLQSLAVSLALGRDAEDYVIYGWELFQRDPLFPKLMLARTPVSGVLIDFFDLLGGTRAVEAGLGLVFAAGVTFWVAAARAYGRGAALAMFVLLAVVPAYGLFHHRVSSDPVFASMLGLVALLAVRLVRQPSLGRSAALGLAIALLVLTRPSGEPFLVLALLPLGLGPSWRSRIGRGAMVAGVALAILGAWAASNALRFGELTIAHGGKSGIPLYRVFVIDPKVSRANGSASREVAAAVEKRLLGMEPYRSYGFDVDEILAAGDTWALDDVVNAVESEYGAQEGSDALFRAGIEAVRADPAAYAKGVALALSGLMLLPYTEAAEENGSASTRLEPASDAVLGPPDRGRRLAPDVAGHATLWARAMIKSWSLESTDRYRVEGGLRLLDDAIWRPLERRSLVWADSAEAGRYEALRDRLRRFVDDASGGDRRPGLARVLRVGSLLLPASGFWILVAAAFGLLFRPRGLLTPLFLAGASFLVLVETALAFPPHPDYALPFVPAFALLGIAALAGSGRRPPTATPDHGSG